MAKELYAATILILIAVMWWYSPENSFKPSLAEEVRYKDVRPIFSKRCFQCHYSSNWDWTDYETAFKARSKIRHRVWVLRNMPQNGDMYEHEREKIKEWVDGGGLK